MGMEGSAAPVAAGGPTNSTPGGDSPSSGGTGSQSQGGSGLDKSVPPASSPKSQSDPGEMYEIPVNGRMVKMTRQEMIDHASMGRAANDKFNEARKMKQETEAWKSKAQKNMIEALQDPALGLSKDQIRDEFEKWYTKEFIEPESLSQDERKMREREAKVKKWEEEQEQKKLKDQEDEETQLTNQQRAHLQSQIIEAMDASGLPKTKFFVSRMAFYMRQNALNGWEAPKEMIVKQVLEERKSILSDMSEGSTAEQLISLLGEGVINKIRKHDLEKLRASRGQMSRPASPSRAGTGVTTGNERLSSAEVNQRLRDIRLGKL